MNKSYFDYPRNAYLVKWNPVLWYHELDGFKPGVFLERTYSNRRRLALSFTAGANSEEPHGELQYERFLWYLLPSLTFSLRTFALEGVRMSAWTLALQLEQILQPSPETQAQCWLLIWPCTPRRFFHVKRIMLKSINVSLIMVRSTNELGPNSRVLHNNSRRILENKVDSGKQGSFFWRELGRVVSTSIRKTCY